MADVPGNVVEIVPDGDAILIVSGMSAAPDTQISLRVSRSALSMASPVFKSGFASASKPNEEMPAQPTPPIVLSLSEEANGDAMFILCNILHLRNDKLASRIPPDLLCRIALLARKYKCIVAAGRATHQWFDRLYTSKEPVDVYRVIEAAYLLDEAVYFARFTTRWVLQASLQIREMPSHTTPETQSLSLMLSDRHTQNSIVLHRDLDELTDSAVFAFSKEYKHYIDYAPTMSPEPDETPNGKPPVECRVDPDAAMEYLGALYDAAIWPSKTWSRPSDGRGDTIGSIVDKIATFHQPEYDDLDKCEFCEDVKGKFTGQLQRLRQAQRDRLWGLCLDCLNAGGFNLAECRFEHPKPPPPPGLTIKINKT